MAAMRRVSREYILQIFAFAVVMADRLLIPAALLRHLGVDGFAGWSVALAWAAFIPTLDFGVTRYFTNQLLISRASGEIEQSRLIFRQGVILVAGLTTIATLLFFLFMLVVPPQSGNQASDAGLMAVIVPMMCAMFIQQMLSIRRSLYRAHQNYARETVIGTIYETVRIGVLMLAIWFDASLVEMAWLWLASLVIFQLLPFLIDSRRLFPDYREGRAAFDRATLSAVARVAPGFWLQTLSMTLFASLPLMSLGYIAAAPLAIAQFGLMRTIANLVRQTLQLFTNVLGLELSRRLSMRDDEGFATIFLESNRFLGVQAGMAAGMLLILGPELLYLWSGQRNIFDLNMMVMAIAAPILLPCAILSVDALAYANRAWVLVGWRASQLAVTAIVFVAVPVTDAGLRMMIALAVGELLGFCVPIMVSIRRLEPKLLLRRQLAVSGYSMAALLMTAAIMSPVRIWPADSFVLQLALGAGLASVAAIVTVASLGLTAERRRTLLSAAQQRWASRRRAN